MNDNGVHVPAASWERQRDLLAQAEAQRQALRLRKMRRAARRVSRAERSLSRARHQMLRVRSDLAGGR